MTNLENSAKSDAVQRAHDVISTPYGSLSMYRYADLMEAVSVLADLSEQIGKWNQDGHTFGEVRILIDERLRLIEHIGKLGATL